MTGTSLIQPDGSVLVAIVGTLPKDLDAMLNYLRDTERFRLATDVSSAHAGPTEEGAQ